MSVRQNAPYNDRFEDDGTALIYEGHDEPRTATNTDPKQVDQPMHTNGGRLTQNGLFYEAAKAFQRNERAPERVRVYEKLRQGIWAYNGVFYLEDAWQETQDRRQVFKFRLIASEEDENDAPIEPNREIRRRRIIPTSVKLEVWKRDQGRCVMCGSNDELHFDHILPYSKGGTSINPDNVQLLCVRHNLEKSDKIV